LYFSCESQGAPVSSELFFLVNPLGSLLTVRTFVPEGLPVQERDVKFFNYEDRLVRVVHVEYGARVNCFDGCHTHHVCAIEDFGESFLLYASYSSAVGRPKNYERFCRIRSRWDIETWPFCDPPGLLHPLLLTRAFGVFAEAERGRGPFRWCVGRFMRTDNDGKMRFYPR